MSAYLSYLYRCGEKRVYGQIVTLKAGAAKMFELMIQSFEPRRDYQIQKVLSALVLSQHRDQGIWKRLSHECDSRSR